MATAGLDLGGRGVDRAGKPKVRGVGLGDEGDVRAVAGGPDRRSGLARSRGIDQIIDDVFEGTDCNRQMSLSGKQPSG